MPALLATLRGRGPNFLAGGVVLDLLVPALAEAARPLMPLTVFVFVLGTLLRVEPAAVLAVARRPSVSVLLPVCAMAACPVAVGLAGHALRLPAAWTVALFFACAQFPVYTLPRIVQTLLPHVEALGERRRARHASEAPK